MTIAAGDKLPDVKLIKATAEANEPVQTAAIEGSADARAVLSVNGALVLLLGVVPGGLMALCAQAVASLFA